MTIKVEKVSWSSGGRLIIDDVSLEARAGRMLGLIGPNGSGKSSLLRLICRLRRVASGVIRLGESDLSTMSRGAIARRATLVEQEAQTAAVLTVEEVVRLGRGPHRGLLAAWSPADALAVETALAHAGLTDRRRQHWHTLSGGERQRVQIARALAQTPSELLLDEPTNHLDIHHQLEILRLVRRLPLTSIVALHDLNLAAMFCDALVVLRDGRVVTGGPPEHVLTPELIEAVFGVAARIEPSPYHGRPHIHFLAD